MQEIRIPPPYRGVPLAAVQAPGETYPDVLVFQDDQGLWYLGPEGAVEHHLAPLTPEEALEAIARMRALAGRWFWMDTGRLRALFGRAREEAA